MTEEILVKNKYGFVPRSVLYFVKDNKLVGYTKEEHRLDNQQGSAIHKTMSGFNSALAEFIIKYWSEPNDLILDPFHGWGTRALISINLNRRYIGYDVSPITYNWLKEFFDSQITLNQDKIKPILYNKDGLKIEDIDDGSVDLIFTCPPYFNIEKYETCEEQLSDINNYDLFLAKLGKGIEKYYQVLKNEKFCIFVVGDWRVNGELKLFSQDVINLFLKNKFLMHDFIIHKLNSVAIVGCANFEANNFVCKSHEYVLVFKKDIRKHTINQRLKDEELLIFNKIKEIEEQGGLVSIKGAKKMIDGDLKRNI